MTDKNLYERAVENLGKVPAGCSCQYNTSSSGTVRQPDLACSVHASAPSKMRTLSLWSFLRDTLSQGATIQMDYTGRGYEEFSARLDQAARERADELEKAMADSSLVLRITTAYEQGFGQHDRAELSNPYNPGQPESEAWNIGVQFGKRRVSETAKAKTCYWPNGNCCLLAGRDVPETAGNSGG